ncbi:MAG: prenyltransferase [Dehalococcoidia bacterium]
MDIDRTLFEKLAAYDHVVVSWVDDDGYPMQTPAHFTADPGACTVRLAPTGIPLPADREVNLIASHIRARPGTGYDQRRYLTLWGTLVRDGDAAVLRPRRAWGWDEREVPFFEYSERNNEQARRYLAELSKERGEPVKPRLSRFWTVFVATRLPFLTATFVPILLGVAVAAYHGAFSWWLAIVTLVGGAAIHIGLNTANDVFDSLSGADEANVNPTQFSGGSRVIQRGLVSLRQMSAISAGAYAVGIGVGLYLVVDRASVELLAIGIAGMLVSVFYTAPPLRLVHRGLGEIATAVGFGPIMVLGAYVVQTKELSWEAFAASVPVAIFIALILYVNEIPDRAGDAAVGKRTLPVRLPQDAVVRGFGLAALSAFVFVVAAAATGLLPRPTLLVLLAAPMALSVYRGIREHYGDPYALMPSMGRNVALHLVTGLLLFAGYIVAISADKALDSPPGILS